MSEFLDALTAALVPLFVLVDPVAAFPIFLSLTQGHRPEEARSIALRASAVGALVLMLSAFGGPWLFGALHLSQAAFRAAGGGLLLLLSIDMLRNKPKSCSCGPEELNTEAERDVAIVPLAVPLLAGPGSIAMVILLAEDAPSSLGLAGLSMAVLLVFALTFAVLRFAVRLKTLLPTTLFALLERLLGLIVAALAVQLIVPGVQALLLGAP